MAETKITKNKVIPFIDTSDTVNGGSWAPTWKRIDKSTIFDLSINPQSESVDYISMESAVEEVSSYQPELPQEIALYRGNPIYDFVESMCIGLPIGDDVKVPFLLCWPEKPKSGGSGNEIPAWQVKECRLLLSNYNSVDGKITFTLKLGGTIQKGTATVTSGTPTFTEDSAE